ncbi:MAG: hypothetical protein DME22_15780 [Verrucomicrobia bacterium]|nr:MAG: hypothetical protein DME22_15780 [Verrucomicrobiota bacterium]PYJ97745.1 MAG: hypothetical protein DME23_13950 [Verrucomicrobiota bacterium]
MNSTGKSFPSVTHRASLFCASLVLNLALASWLSRPNTRSPLPGEKSPRFPTGSTTHVAIKSAPVSATSTNAPPFHWSQIESADYRQYIANLRAVGCPEQTIRDIIAADLNQLYAPRAQAVWHPPKREYWQKPERDQPTPSQLKQLMALDKEKSGTFQELLGVPLKQQGLIDTLYLQVHGSEQQLLFLPPDTREAALRALDEAGFDEKEATFASSHPNQTPEQELFDDKLKILEPVLSPEQLQEFRLRNSWSARMLRTELQYFECTPEEFKTLLDRRDQNTKNRDYGPDLLNRTAATEEVRKLFGDERAKEFQRVTDLFYINARSAAEEQGLPLERADEAWQITRDARAAADQAANNSSLTAEERKRQVQTLREQAETRLDALLGEKAARGVRRDLRNVLAATGGNIRP